MHYSVTGAIIDAIALIIIIIYAVFGAKRGFVKTFFIVFGSLLSLIFAALLCSSVAQFTENKFGFISTVSDGVSGSLVKIFGEEIMSLPLSSATDGNLAQAGVSGFILKTILSLKDNSSVPPETMIKDVISPVFGYYIVAVICAIALYIVFRIIFFLVGELFKKMHAFKVIGALDGSLGFLMGTIQGVIVIEIILSILGYIPLGFIQNINAEISSNTVLTAFLSNINIYNLILKALSKVNVEKIISAVSGS